MANPIIQAYNSYWDEDEEERRKKQQERASNPIIEAYEAKFPTTRRDTTVQKPSQVAQQQQVQQPKEEKTGFFSGVKEVFATLKSQLPALVGTTKTGTGVTLEQPAKEISLDRQIANYEYAISVEQQKLDTGTKTVAIQDGLRWKSETVGLSNEERQAIQAEIDSMQKKVDRMRITEEEKVTLSEKLYISSQSDFEKAVENRKKVYEEYGVADKWSGQWVANEVAANSPQFLASFGVGIATAVVTKNPTLALAVGFQSSYVQEAGSAYKTAKDSGVDDSQATEVANAVGIINATIEMIPLGRALNRSPAGRTAKKGIIATVTAMLVDRAIQGTFEGMTESVQEIVSNAVEKTYNEDKALFENIAEAGVIGLVLGIIGGGVGGDNTQFNIVPDTQVMNPDVIEDLNEAVEEAVATPEESRTEQQQELVDAISTEGTITEEVYYRGVEKGKTGLEVSTDEAASYGKGIYITKDEEVARSYGDSVVSLAPTKKLSLYTPTEVERMKIISLFGKEQDAYIKELLGDEYNGLDIVKPSYYKDSSSEVVIYDESLLQEVEEKEVPVTGKKPTAKEAKETETIERRRAIILENFKRKATKFRAGEAAIKRADTLIGSSRVEVAGQDPVSLQDMVDQQTFNTLHTLALEDVTTDKGLSDIMNDLTGLMADVSNSVSQAKIANKAKKIAVRYERLRVDRGITQAHEYISDREDIKYRELDNADQVLLDESKKEPDVTTMFLEHPEIKGKTELGYTFVLNLANSKGIPLKGYERSVIQEVLEKDFKGQKKIKMSEFAHEIKKKILPLNPIRTYKWSNTGTSNVGLYDGDKNTYVFNSPAFSHGEVGHHENIYGEDSIFLIEDWEIVQIPTTTQYAIVRKGVTLTEENVADNVLDTFDSRESAEQWLKNNEFDEGRIIVQPNKGLFSHVRVVDVVIRDEGKVSFIIEIQSDPFQQGIGLTRSINAVKGEIKRINKLHDNVRDVDPAQQEITDKKYAEDIKDAEDRLAALRKEFEEYKKVMPDDEKLFRTYQNTWHERSIKEMISMKANEGSDFIRFPTARSVALVEGFINSPNEDGEYLPYEIVSGDENQLSAGDQIEWEGDTFTVIDADQYNITVAQEDKVITFDYYEYISEDAQTRWDDIEYNLTESEKELGFNINDLKSINKAVEIDRISQRYSEFVLKDKNIESAKKYAKKDIDLLTDQVFESKKQLGRAERDIKIMKDNKFIDDLLVAVDQIPEGDGYYGLGRLAVDPTAAKYGMSKWGGDQVLREMQLRYGTGVEIEPSAVQDSVVAAAETQKTAVIEHNIDRYQRSLERNKKDLEEKVKEYESVESPTKAELKKLPKKTKKKIEEATWAYSLLDWDVRDVLETASDDLEGSGDSEFEFGEYGDSWRQRYMEGYDPDFDGMYEEVFYEEDVYGNTQVWAVTEGSSESLNQPNEYDVYEESDVSDFNIEDINNDEWKTVLYFYEKQVIPYLQKLRKGNLELVTDDYGNEWWQTKVMPEDSNPPTAYRVKEDLASVGITITDKQEKQILALNKKYFGDMNVKIMEQILYNNKALGSYKKDIIGILAGQANPKDTFYHESVHKYIDVFMDLDEQTDLFLAAMDKYETEDIAVVEERLAEEFIAYAKSREGITGKIKHSFDKILLRIDQYLKNEDVISKMYAEIITPVEKKAVTKAKKKKAKPKKAKPKKVTKTAKKKAAPVIKPKAAEPPKVYGRGQKKVSKLGVGVESRAIEQELIQGFEDIPEYRQLNVNNQINRAVKLLEEDPDTAVAIALGQEQPKFGLAPEAVFKVVEDKALEDGSVDLLRQLATSHRVSEATVMGQRIRLLAERNPESAVTKIRELTEARQKAIEKTKGYTVEKETAKIKKEVSKEVKNIKKGDWKSFIDSIEC